MTFDEFVEELRKAGWVGRNDAQHTHIRELWDSLCYRGLNIPMPTHRSGAIHPRRKGRHDNRRNANRRV
jgi:hypothetical protein